MSTNPAAIPLWNSGTNAADSQMPTLTPYLPAGAGPHPAIVICPGGGYSCRAEHEGAPIAQWLASIGIAGLVVSYRVAPHRHPVPLNDALRAIRYARHQASAWNIDRSRVGILGFSAGGHLSASASTLFDEAVLIPADAIDTQASRPDCAVLCYPVISFGEYRNHGSMVNLTGTENPSAGLRENLSLDTRVSPRTPPTFIWHTADDAPVPVENALLYAAALSRRGVSFALHIFPKGEHGLGLAQHHDAARQWPELCAQWLKELGWRKE